MIQAHLKTLEEKHHRLDEKIRAEELRVASNDQTIRRLKEEKLHLKEEIARLRETES